MNFAICKNCGIKFSTSYRKGISLFCSQECKIAYRSKMKRLDPVLRWNVVPCPDCGQPMRLEKSGHYGILRLACDTENCDVIMIEGSRVIRSALTQKRASPSEVQYLINMLSLPEELYNSIRIIDYQTRKEEEEAREEALLMKRGYLTPVQETNLLCTLADQGFDLEAHEILLPIITWGERRLNLMAQDAKKKQKIERKVLDMHTDAGVTIMLADDESVIDKFLCFSHSVRVLELTREERIQLAAILLHDITQKQDNKVIKTLTSTRTLSMS